MSIEVSEYSKQSGRPIFEIIEDIQEGRMMGHKVGERWYVGEGNDVDVPSVQEPSQSRVTLQLGLLLA